LLLYVYTEQLIDTKLIRAGRLCQLISYHNKEISVSDFHNGSQEKSPRC
jgi:hypothetical protein